MNALPPVTPAELKPLPARSILVVDDARAAVFILARLLETLGQQVRTAYSASEAMQYIQAQRPDIVISDIAMPEMDGYELAQRLRQKPELEGLVLVALTGYGQDSDRRRAHAAGFNYHLVKPVGLETLHDLLGSLPLSAKSNLSDRPA